MAGNISSHLLDFLFLVNKNRRERELEVVLDGKNLRQHRFRTSEVSCPPSLSCLLTCDVNKLDGTNTGMFHDSTEQYKSPFQKENCRRAPTLRFEELTA